MDIRINELQSQIKTTDSRSLLDPAVLKEVVRLCVREVKEQLRRDHRDAQDRKLTSHNSGDR
jgi:hypothetical protein